MRYPLQTDNFTFWDRIKAALFVANKKNKLTTGPKVIELEKEWENHKDLILKEYENDRLGIVDAKVVNKKKAKK